MAADSAFIIWISNYGQIILFFAQVVFWLAVGVAAIWSTLIFRRFVNAKVSSAALGEPAVPLDEPVATAAAAAVPATPISIDEFVD